MIRDNPTVIHKPRSKTSWTEEKFLTWFNAKYADRYELMPCNQDFQSFDYWMLDLRDPQKIPRIIELKAHIGKLHTDRPRVGCDLIKLQKLRGLSVGTKAYIFHLFEDATLVQSIDQPVAELRKTVWNDSEILLALVERVDCASLIAVGLRDLRPEQLA